MILARKVETVAFDRPGGENCRVSSGRPIDLDHLSDQTFGDRDLAEEVLRLFCTQTQQAVSSFDQADPKERQFLAHALKGSARGVGAEANWRMRPRGVEHDGQDEEALDDLLAAIEKVRDFCASIFR